MKFLSPCKIINGNTPEFVIEIQHKLRDASEDIEKYIPESDERKQALLKIQEASFWLTATIGG